MSRPLKFSKLSEAREHENMDRISSLPDELIGNILSFLPTKCAVGTSILSSRWKCLHMLANCLSFVSRQDNKSESTAQKMQFMKLVNRGLRFHKVSPIKKFHLDCGRYMYDVSQLHAWITIALSKKVEQLHLCLGNRLLNALPDCLFTCQTIVELTIESFIQDLQVPETIKLPNLKILHLTYVCFFDSDSFVKLVSSCPLLQELVMKNCKCSNDTNPHVRVFLGELKRFTMVSHNGWFEIDSPKLVYFNIYCRYPTFIDLTNPEHLVTAHVDFGFTDNNSRLQHFIALLKVVHYVKELHLVLEIGKYLSEDDHFPSFPNLTKLILGGYDDGCSYYTWKYVTHLLHNSPRLETVVFKTGLIKRCNKREKWPANVALVSFTSNVKVIEAFRFHGATTELVILKYLLGNAGELKMLIVNKGIIPEKQELQAHKKLLKFPRASESCQIQLRVAKKI